MLDTIGKSFKIHLCAIFYLYAVEYFYTISILCHTVGFFIGAVFKRYI